MPRQSINPDTLFDSLQYGFSQITLGTGSRIVTVSGQVAWDVNEQIVGGMNLAMQTTKALENLSLAMEAAGGSLHDILSLRIYIVESEMDHEEAIKVGLLSFFPVSPPTATWIGVARLSDPEFLVEIEALAVLQ